MDKRQLVNDIAKIRKQIFSITAFSGFIIVCLATILGKGFSFYPIFRNSTLAILGFGAIGFLIGRLYNSIIEEPLIESYRQEAQQRVEELKNLGAQKLAMKVNVDDLSPGMKVLDTIKSSSGALLAREGAVLTNRLIQLFRENNIGTVKVEAARQFNEG